MLCRRERKPQPDGARRHPLLLSERAVQRLARPQRDDPVPRQGEDLEVVVRRARHPLRAAAGCCGRTSARHSPHKAGPQSSQPAARSEHTVAFGRKGAAPRPETDTERRAQEPKPAPKRFRDGRGRRVLL